MLSFGSYFVHVSSLNGAKTMNFKGFHFSNSASYLNVCAFCIFSVFVKFYFMFYPYRH
jgi:hypothetical protein